MVRSRLMGEGRGGREGGREGGEGGRGGREGEGRESYVNVLYYLVLI